MHVEFSPRSTGSPDSLICYAELVFDEPGPLWNMKLVGFSVWRDQEGSLYVTFPARAFGVGPERRFFDYLRAVDGDPANSKNVKSWILAEYRRSGGPQPPTAPAAVGGEDLERPSQEVWS